MIVYPDEHRQGGEKNDRPEDIQEAAALPHRGAILRHFGIYWHCSGSQGADEMHKN